MTQDHTAVALEAAEKSVAAAFRASEAALAKCGGGRNHEDSDRSPSMFWVLEDRIFEVAATCGRIIVDAIMWVAAFIIFLLAAIAFS